MYTAARQEPLELMSHDRWWAVIDNMSLGSQFRQELEHLSRLEASEHEDGKGNMAYLLDQGIAQMSVNLLPFIQHIIVKCGNLGIFTIFRISAQEVKNSAWGFETTNVKARQVVACGKDGELVVLKHFPALELPPSGVVNVTGAGDSLVGSLLASVVQNPKTFNDPATLDMAINRAQQVWVIYAQTRHRLTPS